LFFGVSGAAALTGVFGLVGVIEITVLVDIAWARA
jgi:hypothetical protein